MGVRDLSGREICHVVIAENGLARPGELLVCPDSHTCAGGALNCAARGAGPLDTLQAMTKGQIWYPVTESVRYEFTGELPPHVSGKDVFFHIAQEWGGHTNLSIEFAGPGLAALPMTDRRTNLCRDVCEQAREVFGGDVFETEIPRNVRLSEAPSYGKPVVAYDPLCRGAIAYTRLALELLQRVSGTVGSTPRVNEADVTPTLQLVQAQEAS